MLVQFQLGPPILEFKRVPPAPDHSRKGSRKQRLRSAVILLALFLASATAALLASRDQDLQSRSTWPRADDPREVGVDPAKLEAAKIRAREIGAAAVVIIHDGKLIAEWGQPAKIYPIHSVRKSILSALYGSAVADGTIDLAANLAELNIDDIPPLTAQEKSATVRDLLTARSGVYHASMASSRDMAASLPPRDSAKPGEQWMYQNWDFNALGTIYERATGKDVFVAFEAQLARPLGMEHFNAQRDTRWARGKNSIHPAYEISLSALDLARIGQLFLNKGRWNGDQLVPESWVSESTQIWTHLTPENGRPTQTESLTNVGYGYMWWIGTLNTLVGDRPSLEGSYTAEGMGGHILAVIPKLRTVIVIRANTWLPAWTPFTKSRLDAKDISRLIAPILDSLQ